ncbi:MAG: hypothetical protein QOI21_685 [Actinomycetota bacterium]|jgi:hypothetical protein|nr:hypothetical protein [Actinomycetota bacterium]
MSPLTATSPPDAPRWYVTGALPEPVKTAHLTERDPDDRRYGRSVCGTERARLWDEVDVLATGATAEVCPTCAATLSAPMPRLAPTCPATGRGNRSGRPRRRPAEQLTPNLPAP